jgi:putative membrane protein
MTFHIQTLLIHVAVMGLALWITSSLLKGMAFSGVLALLASALLLCISNIILRPVLQWVPIHTSQLLLGIILLLINGLLIMLIASLIRGFNLSGIGAAFLAALVIAILGMIIELFLPGANPSLLHVKQLVRI